MRLRLPVIPARGIFILQNGRVQECDHFLAAQAGYGMDEVEGTCFASFFDCDSIPTFETVCGRTAPPHRVISVSKATLLRKDGAGLEVRLKADCCLFAGKPAVRVTVTVIGKHVSDRTPSSDLDGFLVSEESLANRPACG
jgi:hypothetical protein